MTFGYIAAACDRAIASVDPRDTVKFHLTRQRSARVLRRAIFRP